MVITDSILWQPARAKLGLLYTLQKNSYGEAAIESVDALLTAAKTCNDAGTGILEYTITYTGVYSEKTFTFKLGYTASSVSAAKTMNISLPSVMF